MAGCLLLDSLRRGLPLSDQDRVGMVSRVRKHLLPLSNKYKNHTRSINNICIDIIRKGDKLS